MGQNRRRLRRRGGSSSLNSNSNSNKHASPRKTIDVDEAYALIADFNSNVGLWGSPDTSAASYRNSTNANILESEQRRIFGGEIGDEVSLCAKMLDVVVGLFGDVDYVDPV